MSNEYALVLPRLRVQNANCISSPMTWGFPAITAFTGFMVALERRLGSACDLQFESIGVVCHHFEAQTAQGNYTRSFCLTRNPVLSSGASAAIVEEGRAHLDITLVMSLKSKQDWIENDVLKEWERVIGEHVAGMRIAGGSVMPPIHTVRYGNKPRLIRWDPDHEKSTRLFRKLQWSCLPGFALVGRDDLLHKHMQGLREKQKAGETPATLLDAWLDLSRINERATLDAEQKVQWTRDQRQGWLVPIPVGYAALSELHVAGAVANARDQCTPFRFVESVYSIGQWVSPHRLREIQDFMWKPQYDSEKGLYRCINHYHCPDSLGGEPKQNELEYD